MKKLIRSIADFYNNIEGMQDRLIAIAVTAVIMLGMVHFAIVNVIAGSVLLRILSALSFLVPAVLFILSIREKNYRTGFACTYIFLDIILLPAATVAGKGFNTATPVIMSGALLLCTVYPRSSRRSASIVTAVAINFIAFMYCSFISVRNFFEYSVSQNIGIYICYAMAAAIIFFVGSIYVRLCDISDRIITVLHTHMDDNVSEALINGDGSYGEGRNINVAVMFADICSFTSLSESMDTDMIRDYINTFFSIAYEAVHDSGGTVDKYIGDSVMAFWKDPDSSGEAVFRACAAASEMRDRLKERCDEINDRFGCELDFAAGINYGNVYVGDVGAQKRKDYTVIGDAVNVASRIQEIASKGEIFLSADAAEHVEKKVELRRNPKKVAVRGKCEPMEIYALESMERSEHNPVVICGHRMTGYVFHICGSRGSYSMAGKRYSEFGGETSCYLLKKDRYALIVDCGSGLQRARKLIEDCTVIDIVLTHLHYDHVIGMMDFSIFPEAAKLTFYGNFDKWNGEQSLRRLFEPPYWPVDMFRGGMVSVNTEQDYILRRGLKVRFYPASHPDNANLAVVHVGKKRICIMSDCENPGDLPAEVVHDCDLLVYDGMYEDKYYDEHVGWGHSTWQEGVKLACRLLPKRLVITHHNPRNSDEKLRGLEIEARQSFAATTFARAGDRFAL